MLGTLFCFNGLAWAEDGNEADEITKAATSISISPVNKVLRLEPNSVYEDSFKVTNNGSEAMDFEVYASPYSYTFSETDNEYRLGFNRENNYTQIVRWITFKDKNGSFVKSPKFVAEPGGSVSVTYRITTPDSIPAGGQYAVLFAHTLSATTTSSGLKTEASPGLVVYGRSEGDTIITSEISSLEISQTIGQEGDKKNVINAVAKIKNTGNVDFMARGKLEVTSIFGRLYYQTPDNSGIISVIPEVELAISDKWDETPYFGIFNATWTVTAGENVEVISKMIVIMPVPVIVLMILLLTIIIVWIIIMVRKRKERRSRFAI